MSEEYLCLIDKNVIDKFKMALQLNAEHSDAVIEDFMKEYATRSLAKAMNSLNNVEEQHGFEDSIYGKAHKKISKWAVRKDQNCHKIIRAYLQLSQEQETITVEALRMRCSDKTNYPDSYTQTFSTNFAQMKLDSAKSHGKVFEVMDDQVILWDNIEPEIMKYKEDFLMHTTDIGYINRNKQKNIGKTTQEGTDHMQYLYKMKCLNPECGYEYFANGSDIFQKKCPKCQGGKDTAR